MDKIEEKNQFKFSKKRIIVLLLIILVGIALCLDLSYIFYKTNYLDVFQKSFCTISDIVDCDGLAQTHYSMTFGIPNALWGLFVYLIFLMLIFVDKINQKFPNSIFEVFKNPRSYMASLGMLIFLASMTLAYVSYLDLKKICILCVCTYVVDLLVASISCTKGFFIYDIKTTIVDFIDGAKKHFILFLIILFGFIGSLYYLNDSLILSPKLSKQKAQREFFEAKRNKYAIKGNILGKENSKVVITIYSDFNCPFCKVINIMFHKLAKHHDVLVQEIAYPLDNSCNPFIGGTLGGHENSCLEAKYALAAKKQEKFWGVANILFYKNPQNEDEIINQIADSHLGIDIEKLKSDANSPQISQELQNEILKANQYGVNATPAFDINGVLYIGACPYEELISRVESAKKRLELDKN